MMMPAKPWPISTRLIVIASREPSCGTTRMSSSTSGPNQPSFTLPNRTSACSLGMAFATSLEIRAGLERSHGTLARPSKPTTAAVARDARTCDDRNPRRGVAGRGGWAGTSEAMAAVGPPAFGVGMS